MNKIVLTEQRAKDLHKWLGHQLEVERDLKRQIVELSIELNEHEVLIIDTLSDGKKDTQRSTLRV